MKRPRMLPQMVYLERIQEAGLRALKLKRMQLGERVSISEIVRDGVDMILKAKGMNCFARGKK